MQETLNQIEVQVLLAEGSNKPVKVSPNHTNEQLIEIAADCVRLIEQRENPNQLQLKIDNNEVYS